MSIVLIISILIKLSEKMQNEEQTLFKASQKKKNISDYDVPVCLWLKQYSVLFLFFRVIS